MVGDIEALFSDYFKKAYGPVAENSFSQKDIIEGYKNKDEIKTIIYKYCSEENSVTVNQILKAIKAVKEKNIEPEYYVVNGKEMNVTNSNNIERIKESIVNNGSLYACIPDPQNTQICDTYKGKTVMNTLPYFSPYSEMYNGEYTDFHAISIIGWDDNFSKLNFPEKFRPNSDGAYLILNSWGKEWGDKGCFWISYEDSMINTGMYAITEVKKEKKDIKDANVNTFGDWSTYTGKEIEQAVTVTYNGLILEEYSETDGGDYEVKYSNNVNVGTATMTITGRGMFKGTITKNFEIRPYTISQSNILMDAKTFIYDGTPKTPIPSVIIDNNTIPTTNYDITYSNNINIGTAILTIKGKGNLHGSVDIKFLIVNKLSDLKNINDLDLNIYYKDKEVNFENGTAKFAYTGSNIEFYIDIYDGDEYLSEYQDYKVSYLKNINVGTATIKITGIGTYTGTISKKFQIEPFDLSKCKELYTELEYEYTGKEIKPLNQSESIRITKEEESTPEFLIFKKDYTTTYKNNTKLGTATVTITGKGNYTGTVTKKFKIVPMNINYCEIKEIPVQIYTGKAIKPNVTVKNGTVTLKAGTDYTISYKNNIKVGTATVIITGKGNYKSNISIKFRIAKSIKNAKVDDIKKQIYNYFEEIEPSVIVKDGKSKLRLNRDYTLKYKNNRNAGTATVVIKGIGNYTEQITKTFKIDKCKITDSDDFQFDIIYNDDVKLLNKKKTLSYTYTGKPIKPSISVSVTDDGGTGWCELEPGKDYELTYKNNINVGTATVTIKGKGNFAGEISFTFNIIVEKVKGLAVSTQNTNSITVKWNKNSNATGYEIYMATSSNGKYSKIATINKNSTTTYKQTGLNEGTTYYFKIRAFNTIQNINKYSAYSSVLMATTKKNIKNVTVNNIANKTYTGKEIKPSVTLKDGKTTLKAGTDYTVSYANNTKVGTATVTIKGKGNYTGTITKKFTIKK